MAADLESAELMARWQSGDQTAARLLFERYAERLVRLAHAHLPQRLSSRLDSEDVVQSVFLSFFAKARERQYVLEQSGDLWRLLAAMTLHKLYRRVEHHSAQKRSVARERGFGFAIDPETLPAEVLAGQPSPEAAIALADELEQVLRALDPLRRRMFELRLQNHTLDEIAAETHRSERTVRRVLEQIKQGLEQVYFDHST